MKFKRGRTSRFVACLVSTVMICQAFLSPVSAVYAVQENTDAQEVTKQAESAGPARDENASNGTTPDSRSDASNSSASTKTAATEDGQQQSVSAQSSDNGDEPSMPASESSAYNPQAKPIWLGDGSSSEITAVIYSDKSCKHPLDKSKRYPSNQTLYGKITFDFDESERPTLEQPNLAYRLPDNVEVSDRGPNPLYDGATLAGTWEVRDGVAYFHYSESYLSQLVDGNPFVVKEASADFDFQIKDQGKGDGESTSIKFAGTAEELTVNHKDGDVSGSKWSDYSDYDADSQTFTWTIEAKVDTVANNLTITDTVGSNLSFVEGSFELVDANGNPVEGTCDVSINDKVATINLGKREAGTYRVRYKTKISEQALKKLKNDEKLENVDNKMSWSWGANNEYQGKIDWPVKPQELKYHMVSKSADSSSTANRIKWTVVLNSGTLKANMGGYTFKDTLDDQQRYLPDGYTVTDESGNTILQGQTDPANNSLAFTMPNDAGEKTYTVTYYTELKNPSDKKKAENSVTVTPPDSTHGPSGSATGTVGPFDSSQYVAKSVVNDSNAAKDGTAEWEAIIDFKAMSKDTDPSSIVFSDSFQHPTPNCSDMRFDAQSVRIATDDGELTAGTDYEVVSPNQGYNSNLLQIQFKNTEAVKSLIGSADAVKVFYTTRAKVADGNGVEPGDYTNKATVQANTITKKNTASAKYTVRASAGVSKKGDAASWDANYTWADGSKGAWISTWEVAVNRGGGKDQYSWKGANDLLGQDVVVNDDLPDGSEYVADSARYSLMKDGYNSEPGKWELPVEPSLSAGKAAFTIPTSDVASDGHWVGWVKLTYQTAVKNPGVAAGESAEVTNSVSASSGETEFPKGTGTSKITNDVLEKKGEQRGGDAAVTYTINVNPHAFDIDSDSNSLTLVDTMDPKCTFVVGSLEVLDADGNTLTEGVSSTLENVSVDNGVATRLTLTVPDSKALTVKYAVIPAGREGDTVSLKNVCELKGFDRAGTTSDQKFVVGHVSGTTAGDSCGIDITKSDEAGNKLKGAKFELYRVDMDASKRGDIKAVKEASAQSDVNGNISFGTKQDPLLSNKLYYFIETVPPEGYEITFKDPTYVMAVGSDAEEYATEFKKAQALGITPSAASTFNVYDKKNEQPSQSPVDAVLKFKKTVNGGSAIAAGRDFSFSLYKAGEDGKAVGGALATASVKPGETAGFSALSFDKAGTYQYVIFEDGELGGGWTKAEPVIATVTIEAVGNGALSVKSVKYSNGKNAALFDNAYAASGSASVSVVKTVNGAAPADEQEFAFELKPVDGAPMPGGAKSLTATTKGAAAASFPDLAYSLKDAGKTYTYRIHEITPATVGWTMADPVTVTVKVGEDLGDGTLGAATVEYSNGNGAALFDNKYEQATGEFQLGLVKTVNGGVPLKGESFEFSATAEGKNAADAPKLANVATGKDGKAAFAVAELSDKDAGKTYTYRIHEITDPEGGDGTWTKAADVIATVKVGERSDDNKLTASVTYRADGSAQAYEGAANFDNTFKPNAAVASIAAGKKSVNGATDVKADEAYTFGLYVKGEDGQRAGKALATVTTKLGETKVFEAQKLSYDKPGTYEYLVHEEDHNGEAGWSAVADVPVTVTVAPKGGSGADARDLTATVVYGDKADAARFADTYTATGEAKLSVSKRVTGDADAVKDEDFAFELRDASGAVLSTATAKAGETADFAPIAYSFADAGKSFEYTIREVGHGSGAWFKPDDVKVTVAVSDRGNGKLGTKVTYDRADEDGSAALFENAYQPASTALKVTKTINGAAEDNAAEEFAFELSARDDAPLPASTTLTVKGTATGSFDKIAYTKPGTYRYTIHETSDLGEGWTNASDVEATVTVERDEAARTLKVTKVEYSNAADDASSALFDNRYEAADTKVALKATKTLSGATLKASQFEFVLKDADGHEIARAKNAADGAIDFPELTYSLEQIGGRGKSKTFEYTIEEVAGSEDGVTYDKAVHKVTVKVSDDGTSGRLVAEVTYDGAAAAPVFENAYTPHTPKESPKKPGGMPSTGDSAPMLASFVAAMGLLVLTAGLKMARRKRD